MTGLVGLNRPSSVSIQAQKAIVRLYSISHCRKTPMPRRHRPEFTIASDIRYTYICDRVRDNTVALKVGRSNEEPLADGRVIHIVFPVPMCPPYERNRIDLHETVARS